jgi:hypothetical protein
MVSGKTAESGGRLPVRSRRAPADRCGRADIWKSVPPVEPGSGHDLNRAVAQTGRHAVAVPFDLEHRTQKCERFWDYPVL